MVAMSFLALIGLLLLPAIAMYRSGVNFPPVAAYAIAVNLLTFWFYARDKKRSREGEWRVPEAHLHLLESLGGWPGAFLAQRRLRHKCSKGSYQGVFWLIVLVYQFVAFDSLRNWQISRAALHRFEIHFPQRR